MLGILPPGGGGQGVEVAKTFLPQKSFGFGLWKEGFETWHIAMFVAGLVGSNAALILTGLVARPAPATKAGKQQKKIRSARRLNPTVTRGIFFCD